MTGHVKWIGVSYDGGTSGGLRPMRDGEPSVADLVRQHYDQGWRELTMWADDGTEVGRIGVDDTGKRTWWADDLDGGVDSARHDDLAAAAALASKIGSTDGAVKRIYQLLANWALPFGWTIQAVAGDDMAVTLTKDDRALRLELNRRGEVRRAFTKRWQLDPKDTGKLAAVTAELFSPTPTEPPVNAQRMIMLDELAEGVQIQLTHGKGKSWYEITDIGPRSFADTRPVTLRKLAPGRPMMQADLGVRTDGYVARLNAESGGAS